MRCTVLEDSGRPLGDVVVSDAESVSVVGAVGRALLEDNNAGPAHAHVVA